MATNSFCVCNVLYKVLHRINQAALGIWTFFCLSVLWLSGFSFAQAPTPTSEFPSMAEGTEVKVVLPDLVSILSISTIEDNELHLSGEFIPGKELRLLISNAETEELFIPIVYVSPDNSDLFINLPSLGLISFRDWLEQERDIILHFPSNRQHTDKLSTSQ